MRRRHTRFRKKQLKRLHVYMCELKKLIKSRGNNVHHITVHDIVVTAVKTIPDTKVREWVENIDVLRFEWNPKCRQHKLQCRRKMKRKKYTRADLAITASREPLKFKK